MDVQDIESVLTCNRFLHKLATSPSEPVEERFGSYLRGLAIHEDRGHQNFNQNSDRRTHVRRIEQVQKRRQKFCYFPVEDQGISRVTWTCRSATTLTLPLDPIQHMLPDT